MSEYTYEGNGAEAERLIAADALARASSHMTDWADYYERGSPMWLAINERIADLIRLETWIEDVCGGCVRVPNAYGECACSLGD